MCKSKSKIKAEITEREEKCSSNRATKYRELSQEYKLVSKESLQLPDHDCAITELAVDESKGVLVLFSLDYESHRTFKAETLVDAELLLNDGPRAQPEWLEKLSPAIVKILSYFYSLAGLLFGFLIELFVKNKKMVNTLVVRVKTKNAADPIYDYVLIDPAHPVKRNSIKFLKIDSYAKKVVDIIDNLSTMQAEETPTVRNSQYVDTNYGHVVYNYYEAPQQEPAPPQAEYTPQENYRKFDSMSLRERFEKRYENKDPRQGD